MVSHVLLFRDPDGPCCGQQSPTELGTSQPQNPSLSAQLQLDHMSSLVGIARLGAPAE